VNVCLIFLNQKVIRRKKEQGFLSRVGIVFSNELFRLILSRFIQNVVDRITYAEIFMKLLAQISFVNFWDVPFSAGARERNFHVVFLHFWSWCT
jgi:hypothetical protein